VPAGSRARARSWSPVAQAVAARRGVPVEMHDLPIQYLHHTEAVTSGHLAAEQADGDTARS